MDDYEAIAAFRSAVVAAAEALFQATGNRVRVRRIVLEQSLDAPLAPADLVWEIYRDCEEKPAHGNGKSYSEFCRPHTLRPYQERWV